ncbi:MAG: ABC transporter ATP-binding protein [Syntrophobacteraceae bacterium]|nr:ABC transporter ATP-binding protein [Syntrophobacteraceae bacterium]
MIRVTNLSFQHRGTENPVLENIGFEVERGEVMVVLGPNGSGKTTLFRCLLGLWKANHGDVAMDGASLRDLSRVEIARRISVVPQDHEPPFPYSAFDVVLMGRAAHVGLFSSPSPRDRRAAFEAMEAMGIEALAPRPYTQISGGERQMVLVARCLAQEAPVMLLDEPTSHLDFRNQVVVLSRVKSIVRNRGLAAVMNLHDPNLALLFADQVLLLNGGLCVARGKPHEVVNKENLRTLYGLEVEFVSENGIRMVYPRL